MWLSLLPALVLSVAPPTSGLKQKPVTTGTESDGPEVRTARAAFQAAQALFARRKYAAAVVKFEEAYAARPHPSVLFNIARCREELGEVPAALRGYREYLRQTRESDAELRRLVAQLERKLRERGVQQLTVYADPAAAQVAIDGRELGLAPATTELPEGEYEVLVTVNGFQPERRRIRHQLGEAEDVFVVLSPLAPTGGGSPAPAPPPPQKRAPPPGESQVKWRGFSSTGAAYEGESGTGNAWHSDSTRDMQAEQAPSPEGEDVLQPTQPR